MKLEDLTTLDQLEDFLSGTQAVAFSVISDKDACCPRAPSRRKRLTLYRWIQGELVKFRYLKLPSIWIGKYCRCAWGCDGS